MKGLFLAKVNCHWNKKPLLCIYQDIRRYFLKVVVYYYYYFAEKVVDYRYYHFFFQK